MSFDISLHDPDTDEVLGLDDSFTDGGTYRVGGTSDCDLNVTYNYSGHFPYRTLDGQPASDTVPALREAVARLGTTRDPDYWAPTSGNAGAACARLLSFAEAHPTGVWRVR